MRQRTKRPELIGLLNNSPIAPPDELITNLYLYLPATIYAKLLYLNELFLDAMALPGDIFEFGVWWGANCAAFANLRAVYEPHNTARKIVGFDTFKGYPKPSLEDRALPHLEAGLYGVGHTGLEHVNAVLEFHEKEYSRATGRQFELVPGLVEETLPQYLSNHPETLIALAYVDLQTYQGTRVVLEMMRPYLMPGSIIAMDELKQADYSGETKAFREVFGGGGYKIRRSRFLPDRSIVTIQ